MSTIAAISTPFGRGGISVIRISGEHALSVAAKIFIPAKKSARGCDLSTVSGGSAIYGKIMKEGKVIDDGIAVVFRAPHSFTGEDTVEISCHGGILLTQRVLEAALLCGARQARAGEFSQRAFLNGKLSLTEAEAIGGLIDAENDEKLKMSVAGAAGVLRRRCDEIYSRIVALTSAVYVKIDYPEEDLAQLSDAELEAELSAIEGELEALISTYKHGKAVSEGVKTALIGKPNTGKSSILNMLCGEEKAIVTALAGTTRDVIEEKVNTGRVILRLFDTAGIRDGSDEVERIGIERAVAKANEAELIIAVFDTSRPLDEQDKRIVSIVTGAIEAGKSVLCLLNKSDKEPCFDASAVIGLCAVGCTDGGKYNSENLKALLCSAANGEGRDEILGICESFFAAREIDYEGEAVVANARQYAALVNAKNALEGAIGALKMSLSADVCGLDLEAALTALGEVDGRTVSGEITDAIFHNFCVGK